MKSFFVFLCIRIINVEDAILKEAILDDAIREDTDRNTDVQFINYQGGILK